MKKIFSGERIKIPEYIKSGFDKYKYILLICFVGILLVLLPSGTKTDKEEGAEINPAAMEYDTRETEKLAEELFSKIDGVGKVEVRITLKSGFETVYAYDEKARTDKSGTSGSADIQKDLVRVNRGSEQEPILLKVKYPEYLGAVIVCEGGDNSRIKLELTQAMKSLTGISADNIVVAKMKD